MRISIIHRRTAVVTHLKDVLSGLGHEVTVLPPDSEDAPGAEVVFVGVPSPAVEGIAKKDPPTWVVGCIPGNTSGRYQAAFAAGADDVMLDDACAQEIAGRADAPLRFARWARAAQGSGLDLGSVQTWTDLGPLVAGELTQMVGVPLAAHAIEVMPDISVGARMKLSLPKENVDLVIGLGMGRASAAALAQLVFGGPVDDTALADAMREFANASGGVIKRCMLTEGIQLAIGLPSDCTAQDMPPDCQLWRLHGSGLDITVWGGALSTATQRLTAGALREGMVIARSIRSANGTILLAEGYVLTERSVKRVIDHVGAHTLVEVARAA